LLHILSSQQQIEENASLTYSKDLHILLVQQQFMPRSKLLAHLLGRLFAIS
jgi:hypothetical protein